MTLSPFRFDPTITDWLVDIRAEPWDSLWQFITVFGDPLTLTLVVIGFFVLAWLGDRIDLAALIVFGGVSTSLLLWALKHLFRRDRPPVTDRLLEVHGLSFPSGHTLNATVVYGLAALICYQLYGWIREHPAALLAAPVLVLAIGSSRVYLGVHWTSDVIMGWSIGLLWLGVCVMLHQWVSRWIRVRTEPEIEVKL